jgi:hypothetical protein
MRRRSAWSGDNAAPIAKIDNGEISAVCCIMRIGVAGRNIPVAPAGMLWTALVTGTSTKPQRSVR